MKSVLRSFGIIVGVLFVYLAFTALPFLFIEDKMIGSMVGLTTCSVILGLIFYWTRTPTAMPISISPYYLFMIILMMVATYFIANYGIASVMSYLFPSQSDQLNDYFDVTSLTGRGFILFFLVTCLVGPFVEEVMFRGLIYEALRKVLPVWPAVLLQALLFGAMHMNVVQGTFALPVGIVLGIIYARSNRLWLVVTLHVLCNAYSAVVNKFWPEISDFNFSTFTTSEIVLFGVVLTVGGIVLIYAYRKFTIYWEKSQGKTAQKVIN